MRPRPLSVVVAGPQHEPSLANVWAEGGLFVWANASRWLSAFERHGWMFTPLHPSVLSEGSLRSMFAGHSSSSASSFSSVPSTGPAVFELSINTALAYGAALLGDESYAEDFFQRARTALEDLLEVDDYAVAEALFALGYYLYGRGDMARFSYYTTLAKDICRRIGASNSGVFLKCMLATIVDPSYTPAEKERTLRRYNRAIKDTPRWDDHHDRYLLDYNNQQRAGAGSSDGVATITLGLVSRPGEEMTAQGVLETVERMRDIDKCITNVLMLIQVHRWMQKEDESGRSLGHEAVDTVLQQWHRLLVVMKQLLDAGESLPKTFKLTTTLCWICFSAAHAHRSGNIEEALRLGTLYLERVKEESVELCTSSCINMAEIIMDLYFDLGRDDMVEALLTAARPLFERYRVCRDRTAIYWTRLEERRLSSSTPPSPASSPLAPNDLWQWQTHRYEVVVDEEEEEYEEEAVWPSPASSSPTYAQLASQQPLW